MPRSLASALVLVLSLPLASAGANPPHLRSVRDLAFAADAVVLAETIQLIESGPSPSVKSGRFRVLDVLRGAGLRPGVVLTVSFGERLSGRGTKPYRVTQA